LVIESNRYFKNSSLTESNQTQLIEPNHYISINHTSHTKIHFHPKNPNFISILIRFIYSSLILTQLKLIWTKCDKQVAMSINSFTSMNL